MTTIRLDVDRCVCCGDCAAICPVLVYRRVTPPCQAACPLGTDVEGYVSLIAQGKFAEALEVNRRVNPLPLTLGRVCTHPCETKCQRGAVDEPVAICQLKRFVGDRELAAGGRLAVARVAGTRPERVAIVGSGPAGLGAAQSLAAAGYGVTVFEQESIPGGMLHWGIPDFRLPKDIVAREIADIMALGVEMRTGVTVGASPGLDDLRRDGYDAVLLAIGVQQCRLLGIPGEDGPGVYHCLQLMRQLASGQKMDVGENVVVIGGGNVAIDGARAVRRLGARKVTVICVESRQGMPAGAGEVMAAEEEGIGILPSRQCLQIIRRNGRIKAVEYIELASMRFEEGRLITEQKAGTEQTIRADMVLLAIGQFPDVGGISGLGSADIGRGGRISVNPFTMATSRPWLFAAGDAVLGPSSVVEAVASGKKAAAAIDRYLRGEKTPPAVPPAEPPEPMVDRLCGNIPRRARQKGAVLGLGERVASFKEVELGLDAEKAVTEARRCLGCGVFGLVDETSCCSDTCRLCSDTCWQQALTVVGNGSPSRARRTGKRAGR